METVRVFRILQYVGPRGKVEAEIEKSIHGTREFADVKITATTMNEFPEPVEAHEVVISEEKFRNAAYGMSQWISCKLYPNLLLCQQVEEYRNFGTYLTGTAIPFSVRGLQALADIIYHRFPDMLPQEERSWNRYLRDIARGFEVAAEKIRKKNLATVVEEKQ